MCRKWTIPAFLFLFLSAATYSKDRTVVKIGWIGGMTSLPFVYMMDDTEQIDFIQFNTIQSLIYNLSEGKIDAANLPINLALSLSEKISPAIQLICITQNADYYIVCKKDGKTSFSFSDFLGKEIAIAQRGLASGLIEWILGRNNIPIGNGENAVKIRTVKNEASAVSEVLNGKTDAALLSEPAVSAAINTGIDFAIAIDLQDEFEKINGRGRTLPKTALLVRTQFANENPLAIQTLLKKMEDAISRTLASPMRTYALTKKHPIGVDNSVFASAIPRANYICIAAKQAPGQIRRYLEVYSIARNEPPLTFPKKDFFYNEEF